MLNLCTVCRRFNSPCKQVQDGTVPAQNKVLTICRTLFQAEGCNVLTRYKAHVLFQHNFRNNLVNNLIDCIAQQPSTTIIYLFVRETDKS